MKALSIRCDSPILIAEFGQPQAMLSWSLTRPGFTTANSVAWLHVRDDDLPLGIDPVRLLRERMSAAGLEDAVHLMTSRDIRNHHLAEASAGPATATCLATVGLGNAGRVGATPSPHGGAGTINLLVHVDRPLSQAALVEAISIAAQARTVAVVDLGWKPHGEVATGTGTDCIVVAAPASMRAGMRAEQFAGLHTDVGAAVGRAVYDAVFLGGNIWVAEQASGRA
ncbi:MAG: adenosylcobinamide amidohydrolase [Pseudomonadota bacterium]|nr:adenosylcobinamide amidohydrolase [Pseudomonadota bacterium]